MNLSKAQLGVTYRIECVQAKLKTVEYLLTLGCFEGEQLTLVSKLSGNYVVSLKDSRYAIDEEMAKDIVLEIL